MALRLLSSLSLAAVFLLAGASHGAAPTAFLRGDQVKVVRGETLMFQGKKLVGAPKGQIFTVLKHDGVGRQVFVEYYKADGALIAAALPAEAVEAAPPDAWLDLLGGTEAFREQRYEDCRRLLGRATQDAQYKALAGGIAMRINGCLNAVNLARSGSGTGPQAFANTVQSLRETSSQLVKSGHLSLAHALEEGADRLAAQVPAAPPAPTRVNRADLAQRAGVSQRSVALARQAMGTHRLMEATRKIDEGLAVESERPDLKAMRARVQKEIQDAEESYEAANRMRRFEKGAIHALTALDRGLKYCADHPKLLALKLEMQTLFEARTSPQVTPALAKASGKESSMQALQEGRKLYVERCTECHELELLDSRSMSGWRDAVGGMARRAGLDGGEQARILDYLSVAQSGMDQE